MSRPCDQCLVTPQRVVSGASAAQYVRKVTAKDCAFICHKSTRETGEIVCRGVEDKRGPCQMHRIAGRLGVIVEIDPETLEPVKP